MNKNESTMLKEMRSGQTILNRKMDKLTSDLCLMKIEIGHIDHDIIAMEQNNNDSTQTHRDRNNNPLENEDRVKILTGTTKAKKNAHGIFLDVTGAFANVRVTDANTKRKTIIQRMTKNLLLLD